jgi:hypothetical protein
MSLLSASRLCWARKESGCCWTRGVSQYACASVSGVEGSDQSWTASCPWISGGKSVEGLEEALTALGSARASETASASSSGWVSSQ